MVAKGNVGRQLPRSFGLSAGPADASFSAGRGARGGWGGGGRGRLPTARGRLRRARGGEGLESVEKNKCFWLMWKHKYRAGPSPFKAVLAKHLDTSYTTGDRYGTWLFSRDENL